MPKICPPMSRRFYVFAALAILISSVVTACTSAEETGDVSPATAEPSIISVMKSGNPDGRTVLLIPGLASSADLWTATKPLLEADYDVRTVQIAGFAGTDPVTVTCLYTDAIAEAVIDELRKTPAKDAVLVGHSMGGFVSLKAALAAPDLIDELVIVDSVPFLAGLFFPEATPESAAAQAPVMATQMAAMSREAFDAQQKQGLVRLVKTRDFLPTLEDWGRTSDQATVAAITGEMLGTDLRADLSALKTEALIMVPHDAIMGVPVEQIKTLYEAQYAAAPNARLELFNQSFHFIMIDQADAFHTSLRAALAD